jgi:hypothetical protein
LRRNHCGDRKSVGGYVPNVGDTFIILSAAGGRTGTFSAAHLPTAAGGTGLIWQVQYNVGNVSLALISKLTGDYNGNGIVDAADYIVWRKSLGQAGPALAADGNGNQQIDTDDYNVWRAQFGQSAGAGAVLGSSGEDIVPESATWGMLLSGMLMLISRRYS